MQKITIILLLSILFIPSLIRAEDKPKNDIDKIISYAKTFIGVPYKYGGTSPNAFDCSGFVRYVFNNFRFDLEAPSYGLAEEEGFKLPISDLRKGDLIFFRKSPAYSSTIGHVGIVVENKSDGIVFIHASSSRGVVVSKLRSETYFQKRAEGGIRF